MSTEPPVAVVGAGPTGIACAVELGKRGVAAVCYERGGILDTLYRMPEEMRWFSTRELLGIAGVPFAGPEPHPTRLETLAYYRAVADAFEVKVVPETEIESIVPREGGGVRVSAVRDQERSEFAAAAAVIATGFFGNPKRLGVPGEDLPVVHSRYVSGYPFHGRDVLVVGGKNSAAEAALDLYRHGARVTLVVRAAVISDRVKYWIKPDLENRIRAGSIAAYFQSRVLEIERHSVRLSTPAGERTVSTDAVFPLIGYEPDFAFFDRCGIRLEGTTRAPAHDPGTLESNVPGIFLAGALLGGAEIGRIFIENSRHHAAMIADAIAARAGGIPATATSFPAFRTSPGNDPDR
ncbi:MAG: YpdA family putative bacillithiol disulfide reductase [Acidobacteriota bacterium]|nr:YpdA family putative bacillithiol disulfide reductase [Acidobacteriota bacterium]